MHSDITLVETKNKSFKQVGFHQGYEFHVVGPQLQLHLVLTQYLCLRVVNPFTLFVKFPVGITSTKVVNNQRF